MFGRATDNFNKSEDALKQAVAMKYHHLSRRKFDLVCKTQSSVFDPKQETWLPRCIKHKDVVISLRKIVSDTKVDNFEKSRHLLCVSNTWISWCVTHCHWISIYDS